MSQNRFELLNFVPFTVAVDSTNGEWRITGSYQGQVIDQRLIMPEGGVLCFDPDARNFYTRLFSLEKSNDMLVNFNVGP
jgi:hypothetical protein